MNAPIKGKHYKTGRPVEVSVEQGRITSVTELAESPARADWPWLAPGLVDLQVNGAGGWISIRCLYSLPRYWNYPDFC